MTTDLADDRIDQLARRAVADLRATAAQRAATLGAPRRRRRVLPQVIAVGATMALLAALSSADPQVNEWSDKSGDGAIAITADTSATALRVVTTTGERYVVDLVSVPARRNVRLAAIVVPPTTFVSADLVDAAGDILGALGPIA